MGDDQDRDQALYDALRFALKIVDRHAAIIESLAANASRKGHKISKAHFDRYAAEIRLHAAIIRTEIPGLSERPATIN